MLLIRHSPHSITLCIVDPSLRKRLEFKAHYNVQCSILSDIVSKQILMTTAKHYGGLVQQICGLGESIKVLITSFIILLF